METLHVVLTLDRDSSVQNERDECSGELHREGSVLGGVVREALKL